MTVRFDWPGPVPDLTGGPTLEVEADRGQAWLHHYLCDLGYVPEQISESSYRFDHPDPTILPPRHHSTFLILCPYVHRPTFDTMTATLAPDLYDHAVIVDNTETNLGTAGSRNVGARRLLNEGIDWLVDISPVVRFGPSAGWDFIALLDDYPDAWVVQSSTPINWHLIAWHRRLFETVGLFDENFHPIYGEDGDMAYRVELARRSGVADSACWANIVVDAWITMYGHSAKLAGIVPNMKMIWSYFEAKWGGLSGNEQYEHPFGDETNDLAFWPVPPDPHSIYDKIRR